MSFKRFAAPVKGGSCGFTVDIKYKLGISGVEDVEDADQSRDMFLSPERADFWEDLLISTRESRDVVGVVRNAFRDRGKLQRSQFDSRSARDRNAMSSKQY